MSEPGTSSRQGADCRGGAFTIEGLRLYLESRISAVETLQNERYHWGLDKFKALDNSTEKALAAVEKQTAAAFAANKESVLKTEEAQKSYNLAHNDLTRKMENQAAKFVDRERLEEFEKRLDSKLDTLKTQVVSLQESKAASGERRSTQFEQRQQANWTASQVITTIFGLIGTLTFLFALLQFFLKSQKP